MNFTWVSNLCNDFWLVQAPRAAAAVFIIFNLVAMQLYPGGTIHNPHSANYQLTQNFFSDLGRAVAFNGAQNFHASLLFNLTLLIIGVSFSIFYFVLPDFFRRSKANHTIATIGTVFGLLSGLSFIGLALAPSDLYLNVHIIFANGIFRMTLATSLCFGIVIYRSDVMPSKYAFGYGIFALFLAVYIGIGEFGPNARESEAAMIFQVISQKLIVVIFLLSVVYQTFGFSNNPDLIKNKRMA